MGVLIENNHIHDFHQEGKDSHGVVIQATSRNITVRGNHIHDTSGDAVQCLRPEDGKTKPADGVLIENNRLESTQENVVDIKTSKNIIVRGNHMRDFRRKPGRSGGDAIIVHYSAENVLIVDNDISEAGRGISVGGIKDTGMPGPSHVVVRDNTIHDIPLDRAKDDDAVGIRVNNASDVQLINNVIKRTDSFAVRLGNGDEGPSTDVKVIGNTMLSSKLVRVGQKRPGLEMDLNHYARGGLFQADNLKTPELATWQRSTGLDANSDQDAREAGPDSGNPLRTWRAS